ncbi:MAG: hypothetical protein CME62_04740 [Halobacteriovoraceae bacterium]|nr:hypothetical protein [Halobacteriovoraceae bacterium]|tara:strand:+ start:10846 stop:11529 length:684 start_codon:yes stop_codon:yes gene_type:complete
MAKGFRVAGTLKEFLNDLEVLKDEPHHLIIWQNDEKGQKIIFDGQYLSYAVESEQIIIHLQLLKNAVFHQENPVYIYEKAKGILFKGQYKFCVNNVLKVLADEKVFLREKRKYDRFHFNYTKVKASLLMPFNGKQETHDFALRDVGSGGLAFKVSKGQLNHFPKNLEIELCSLGGIDLPKAIKGTIAHRSRFHDTNALDNAHKLIIGMSFQAPSKLITKVMQVMGAS